MKTKILVVLSNIHKALEHEWFVDYIDKNKFSLEFVLINAKDSEMDKFLNSRNIPVFHFSFIKKSDLFRITYKIYQLITKRKFDIVHSHLFEAYLCGMMAAWFAGVKKRIITRHHSDYHHTWHPHAVKYDRLVNFLSTDIVAISGIVKDILVNWERVNPVKVHLIHHGLDPERFILNEDLKLRISKLVVKHNIPKNKKVIGVVSRFIEWKGIQYIIPAFKELLETYSDVHLILANATGIYKPAVENLLKDLPPNSYSCIEFENDGAALFASFDYFVHVPVSRESEAFGQVYIEALFSRKPSVFTKSGIAADIASDGENCIVVPFKNSKAITEALIQLIQNPGLSDQMGRKAFESVKAEFDVRHKINKLENLYSGIK